VEDADQAEVHPHVAVEDVAEFVGHYALQLVAVEVLERSAGDADHRVARLVARGKGVDARFVIHHVDGRDGRAGSQGHLLDHVQQPAFGQVAGLRIDQPSAEHQRDRLAAGGELHDLVEAAQQDQPDRGQSHQREDIQMEERFGVGVRRPGPTAPGHRQRDQHHEVDRHDDRHHGQDEVENQPSRPAAGSVLLLKEVHGRGWGDSGIWGWALGIGDRVLGICRLRLRTPIPNPQPQFSFLKTRPAVLPAAAPPRSRTGRPGGN